MDDALFWSQPGGDEQDEQEAMMWAEARLEEARLADYWPTRRIVPGYPVAMMPNYQEKLSFAGQEAKMTPTGKDLEVERIAVGCFIVSRGPWQSATPRRLSLGQRGLRLVVSVGLTEDERAEVAALVESRRDGRNTRQRNARSRRAA